MMQNHNATAKQGLPVVPMKSFPHGSGRFETSGKGVFFASTDREGNDRPPKWICSPLHVVAKTREERNAEWG
ncbi:hypothetical protein IMCC9480_913 [Oxalobacteraceae bacterium IMCC9480]|nr:hypothetical protein IMCC9480_913 [Oxalobacteraceae bacterium IMCC9480]